MNDPLAALRSSLNLRYELSTDTTFRAALSLAISDLDEEAARGVRVSEDAAPTCCELACYEDPGCACDGCRSEDAGLREAAMALFDPMTHGSQTHPNEGHTVETLCPECVRVRSGRYVAIRRALQAQGAMPTIGFRAAPRSEDAAPQPDLDALVVAILEAVRGVCIQHGIRPTEFMDAANAAANRVREEAR